MFLIISVQRNINSDKFRQHNCPCFINVTTGCHHNFLQEYSVFGLSLDLVLDSLGKQYKRHIGEISVAASEIERHENWFADAEKCVKT